MWPLRKCDDEVQRVATWAVAQVCTLSAEILGTGGAHCQAIVFPIVKPVWGPPSRGVNLPG